MHPDLSTHLHTAECTELIRALKKCHTDNKFSKFWGACNAADHAMLKCLKQERIAKRQANFEKSMFKQQLDREKLRKERISSNENKKD